VVDDLTGKKLGRASSGTFRTADVVGLDTLAHVVKTLQDTLDEKSDPFYPSFATPEVLKALLEKGNLVRRARPASTRRSGATSCVSSWRAASTCPVREGRRGLWPHAQKPAAERLKLLRNAEGPQGQFLWAILRNSFHYAAVHLASIANTAPMSTSPCAGASA